MKDTPDQAGDLRSLRLLRTLVIVLMVVMIAGFLLLIALLVINFPGRAPAPDLPDSIVLPGGAVPTAFTQGPDWYAVVTADGRILVFDRAGGTLLRSVEIRGEAGR